MPPATEEALVLKIRSNEINNIYTTITGIKKAFAIVQFLKVMSIYIPIVVTVLLEYIDILKYLCKDKNFL